MGASPDPHQQTMAPFPYWIHGFLHSQRVIASDASSSEKAIVLLVAGDILVIYAALCWLGANTITGEPHHETRALASKHIYRIIDNWNSANKLTQLPLRYREL